jgi:hypothetical protein
MEADGMSKQRRRLRASVLLALLAFGTSTTAQTLKADGNCRDGQPHGAWQLADASGNLRVLGAFSRGKRTGSFIHWTSGGVRIAHIPYEEDARNGTLALWYAMPAKDGQGPQRLEAIYAAGKLNGNVRVWDREGRLRGDYRYAAGVLVDVAAWDARGRPLPAQQARAQAEQDVARSEADQGDLEQLVDRYARGCRAVPGTAAR